MMMAKRRKGLSERHKKILEVLESYQAQSGYPPSIREIGKKTGISSTSVVNYYLNQLEEEGYIERDRKISRGVRLVKTLSGQLADAAHSVRNVIEDLIRVPVIGRIVAGQPMPVPGSDFGYYDPESGVEIARSLLAPGDKVEDLFALEVQGDSMVDAMVNDGDIVVMKRAQEARNGEMVAVWLNDRDETTLKYFYKENGRVRLQPANPTMQPIFVDNPRSVRVQGKVVMVIRQMGTAH
ncbi:MAG: transcriptional repressor LexA [Anaerolineales bacterium]